MLSIHTDNIGDISIVECIGRIVQSEAAFKLREAVTSHGDARIVVLDLSEVRAIEGGGLGMMWFLQRWAQEHCIQLKLFNPTLSVRHRLEHTNPMLQFHFASPEEIVAIVALAKGSFALAA